MDFHVSNAVKGYISNVECSITLITCRGVEYTSKDGEAVFAGWAVLKCWEEGNYVQHHGGQEGWIIAIDKKVVRVILKTVNLHVEVSSPYSTCSQACLILIQQKVEIFSGHVNLFVAASPPYDWQCQSALDPQKAPLDDGLKAAQTFQSPWKWREVALW